VDSLYPRELYYDQRTTMLPLPDNDSCISPQQSVAVTLPDIHKDASGNALPFTFIIAEAETLAPVRSVTCKADLSDLEDLTIDDTAIDDIREAFDFHKNITALPYSNLATAFGKLDHSNEQEVNAYLAGTITYKHVTLDSWYLVRSYYNALPYGWAGGKDTVIYLYSGAVEDVEDVTTVRSIGTITLANDWTQPLTLTVPDRFKIRLKLDNDTEKTLKFSNGVFWDSSDTDTARLSLAGAFIIPSQLTLGDGKDDIVTLLAGTINGKKAFGIEGNAHDNKDDGGFLGLLDKPIVITAAGLALSIIGIALGIGILVKLSRLIKWNRQHGDPAASQQERDAQTEQLKQYIDEKIGSLAARVNSEIVVPRQDQLPAEQASLKQRQLELKAAEAKEHITRMSDAQYDALEMISREYVSRDLEMAYSNLGKIDMKMNDSNLDISKAIEDSMSLLSHNLDTIVAAQTFIAKRFTAGELAAYKESMKVYEDTRVILDDTVREMKEIEAGNDEREIIVED
jgi:hypothetical protein